MVDTLELMGVALHHNQTILFSFEQLRLIKYLVSTSPEVSLSLDYNVGAPFNATAKPSCLLLVSVCVDHQGEPQSVDLLHGKSIEVRFILQVLILCSVLLPLKSDLELQLDRVTLLINFHNFIKSQ